MITLLTQIAPIFIGYAMKLLALRNQASTDLQKLQLQALMARNDVVDKARESANKESPWAAMNRRVIIFTLLMLIVFIQVAPVLVDIPTVIPEITKGISFLGFQITADKVEYVVVEGMMGLRNSEVASWFWLIIEMYFGATIARGK